MIELELWQIDDSAPGVRFNIIEKPNEWAKTVKSSSELSEIQKFKLKFWEAFNNYVFTENSQYARTFTKTKSQPQNWKNIHTGIKDIIIDLTISTQKNRLEASLYFRNRKEEFFRLEN